MNKDKTADKTTDKSTDESADKRADKSADKSAEKLQDKDKHEDTHKKRKYLLLCLFGLRMADVAAAKLRCCKEGKARCELQTKT